MNAVFDFDEFDHLSGECLVEHTPRVPGEKAPPWMIPGAWERLANEFGRRLVYCGRRRLLSYAAVSLHLREGLVTAVGSSLSVAFGLFSLSPDSSPPKRLESRLLTPQQSILFSCLAFRW